MAPQGIAPAKEILHASCVAIAGRAVLIRGASGAGKSSLALQCIGLGAALVSDDRTAVTYVQGQVVAQAPDSISGLIEARGVGLLNSPAAGSVAVALVVDLDQTENERLPPMRETLVLGQPIPMLLDVDAPYFPAAVLQYLRHGRRA